MSTLLLNRDEVKSLITMKDVVETCDKTFKGLGDGTVICPPKLSLPLGEHGEYPGYLGTANSMPTYIGYQKIQE